jgi:biopolymer transport protein ExbB
VLELIKAGGFLMWPLILCSVIAAAIAAERFWTLQSSRVTPKNLVAQIWQWEKVGHLDAKRIQDLRLASPLGRVLAAGLVNRQHDREVMKESIEEVGRHVAHDLERFLNTLGTIASITPLLGLLGTVIGMIKVFTVITAQGVGDPAVLAEGISEALITTAAGLTVAIPSLMFYRYFRGRIDELIVSMEQEALKMIEVMHGQREKDEESESSV